MRILLGYLMNVISCMVGKDQNLNYSCQYYQYFIPKWLAKENIVQVTLYGVASDHKPNPPVSCTTFRDSIHLIILSIMSNQHKHACWARGQGFAHPGTSEEGYDER